MQLFIHLTGATPIIQTTVLTNFPVKFFAILIILAVAMPRNLASQNGTCNNSVVFCSTNAIQYNAGVNTGNGEPGPCYSCLGSTPNPAWFYMQMQNNGDVTIKIESSPPRDIDFCLWGPFDHPTTPCVAGLTCDKVEDCSYAGGTAPEYADITGGIAGEFYILILTNFSNQPTEVTFFQSGGSGLLNCNIVFECSVVAISTIPTACNPANNTYNVSGQIIFTNPPSTGTLTISDNTGASQVFTPPFTSPRPYTLSNIPCDGATHTITASFSANATCNKTVTYTAPEALCPIASIKGGGEACNGSTVPVIIDLAGLPPFNFTYAIDGISQPEITAFPGPSPYIVNAGISGTYTLVSVSNSLCAGTTGGSATVTIHPLPVVDFGPDLDVCPGTVITLDAGPGYKSYTWSTGAVTPTINTSVPGTYSVTVSDFNNCQGGDAINIIHNPVPVAVPIKHN